MGVRSLQLSALSYLDRPRILGYTVRTPWLARLAVGRVWYVSAISRRQEGWLRLRIVDVYVREGAMTISRERMMIALTGPGQAEFASPGARHTGRNPWLLVSSVARQAPDLPPDLLCLIAEPIDTDARVPAATGAGILAGIRDIYAASDVTDPIVALTAALDAANLALYQQNSSTAPGRRLLMGLTCLVARGRELLICQVPPTQLILAQDGMAVALPELTTWSAEYQPHAREISQGLGVAESLTPALFRATLEQGDLITFCSSNLARVLATGDGALLESLLGVDPVEAVETLASLAEQHELDPAYAASVAPQVIDLPPARRALSDDEPEPADDATPDDQDQNWFGRSLREMRSRSPIIPWPRRGARRDDVVSAGLADEDSAADTLADSPLRLRRDLRGAGAEPAHESPSLDDYAVRINHTPRAGHDRPAEEGWDDEPATAPIAPRRQYAAAQPATDADEDFRLPSQHRVHRGRLQGFGSFAALLLLGIGTIVERIVPRGGTRRNARYLEGGRGRVWPIGSLERYRRSRRPAGRVLPFILVGVLLVLVVGVVLAVRSQRAHAEQARFDNALAAVSQAREAATTATDRQAAHAQLLALPATLAAIPAADKPGRPERIAAEAAALRVAQDNVAGVQRIAADAIALLAPWPATAAPSGPRPQLVVGDGKPYVLSNGTVYWLNGGKALTKLVGKGDTVAGVSVAAILGIAWRENSLLVYTETQGFVRDSGGTWTALPLAANGRKITASDSFGGNLYFLEAERGQIVKYASGTYNQPPQPWSTAKLNADIAKAVDLTIDADIYALLGDGRVLDLYQGDVKATLTPATVPALAGATAIGSTLDGKWLYILDSREGRIVRLGRDGSQVTVYKPADGAKPFTGARDLAVDEAANIVYLTTDEGVLTVRLP